MSVYVILYDKVCEFGAPLAVWSTRELALADVQKRLDENPYAPALFVFPFTLDGEPSTTEKPLRVTRTEAVPF